MNMPSRLPFLMAALFIFVLSTASPAPTQAANRAADEITLRSEDLVPMWMNSDETGCHQATCGSAYPSCADWSQFYICGENCRQNLSCPENALYQRNERYRVCFNSQGEQCTEYSHTFVFLQCGC